MDTAPGGVIKRARHRDFCCVAVTGLLLTASELRCGWVWELVLAASGAPLLLVACSAITFLWVMWPSGQVSSFGGRRSNRAPFQMKPGPAHLHRVPALRPENQQCRSSVLSLLLFSPHLLFPASGFTAAASSAPWGYFPPPSLLSDSYSKADSLPGLPPS